MTEDTRRLKNALSEIIDDLLYIATKVRYEWELEFILGTVDKARTAVESIKEE